MAVPILVVTRNAGFGELICQILEETGKYALALATNGADAASIAKKEQPALCILETELEGVAPRELVGFMREEVDNLLLILIPPDDDPEAKNFTDLHPAGTLSKPFYLPDLVSKVEEVIESSGLENLHQVSAGPQHRNPVKKKAAPKVELPPPPEWLQDVSLAARHLASLSIETSSQASMITKNDQIWAYAGELPQLAAEELGRLVATYFADGGGIDLARFIKLEATGGEHMLYASGLGGDYVLAMVFDAEVPFSKIRTQANRLADGLATRPPENMSDTAPHAPNTGQVSSRPVGSPAPVGDSFSDLLDDVPPPIPTDWIPESMVPQARKGFLDELLDDDIGIQTGEDPFSFDTVAVPRGDSVQEKGPFNVALDLEEYELEATVEGAAPVPDYQAETIASKVDRRAIADETVASSGEKVKLEPVSPSVYNLTYACVLIPRFPHHHLTGDIAARLADWISHMCLAFGWRLEHLALRPEYIEWLVNVPPNTSPGYLMRTIRQHTSRRMFVEFPTLEEDNPSGDFWAPGYLIMSGTQPPPAQLVKEFIRSTRKRQGLKK